MSCHPQITMSDVFKLLDGALNSHYIPDVTTTWRLAMSVNLDSELPAISTVDLALSWYSAELVSGVAARLFICIYLILGLSTTTTHVVELQ